MTDILGANYSVWNKLAGGYQIAKPGKPNDGDLIQDNQPQGSPKTVNVGASKNGNERIIFAGNKTDTFNLSGGWKDQGYTVSNGMGGEKFTTKQGDQILISAPAGTKLSGDYTGQLGGPLKSNSTGASDTPTRPGSVISNTAPPSKEYAKNITDYARKYAGKQGNFSAEDLSKLYGFKVTDQTSKNLDLNGDGKVSINEATAGLAFEDNTGAKADGKISSADINSTKSLFALSTQGSSNEIKAKIGANKDTITRIENALNLPPS